MAADAIEEMQQDLKQSRATIKEWRKRAKAHAAATRPPT